MLFLFCSLSLSLSLPHPPFGIKFRLFFESTSHNRAAPPNRIPGRLPASKYANEVYSICKSMNTFRGLSKVAMKELSQGKRLSNRVINVPRQRQLSHSSRFDVLTRGKNLRRVRKKAKCIYKCISGFFVKYY